jgi:hypothetical protein
LNASGPAEKIEIKANQKFVGIEVKVTSRNGSAPV